MHDTTVLTDSSSRRTTVASGPAITDPQRRGPLTPAAGSPVPGQGSGRAGGSMLRQPPFSWLGGNAWPTCPE